MHHENLPSIWATVNDSKEEQKRKRKREKKKEKEKKRIIISQTANMKEWFYFSNLRKTGIFSQIRISFHSRRWDNDTVLTTKLEQIKRFTQISKAKAKKLYNRGGDQAKERTGPKRTPKDNVRVETMISIRTFIHFGCNKVPNNATMSIGAYNHIRLHSRPIFQYNTRFSCILVKIDVLYRSFKSDRSSYGNCQSI